MSDIVRWGILGAAKFAQEHMGPAINSARGAIVAGIASGSPEKIALFQNMFPGCSGFDSYDALLASPEIDAVYVPLPNTMHVEWGLKAMDAGKHVLIEKPVAMAAPDIDALIAKRDATGLKATEAYMIVHHPQWIRVRQLVQDGAIGALRHITCAFSFDNRDPDNIRNRLETGGGALPDIGVYSLGCARFVTGLEAHDVSASIDMDQGVDTMARVQAMFGDASYSGYVSTRMHLFQEVVFHGEQGVIRLTAPFNANVYDIARIEIMTDGMGLAVERFPGVNQYVQQVENFGAFLRENAPYPWSLEDAQRTQRLIDRVYVAGNRPK